MSDILWELFAATEGNNGTRMRRIHFLTDIQGHLSYSYQKNHPKYMSQLRNNHDSCVRIKRQSKIDIDPTNYFRPSQSINDSRDRCPPWGHPSVPTNRTISRWELFGRCEEEREKDEKDRRRRRVTEVERKIRGGEGWERREREREKERERERERKREREEPR